MSILNDMGLMYEPKKENRFIIHLPENLNVSKWVAYATERPTYKLTGSDYTWEPIQIKFRDPIGPSATQAIMEWVRLHSESVTGRMGYAAGYKKMVNLEMLDPTGVVVEKWQLEGTLITKVAWSGVGYSDDKLADFDVTFQMDRCILVY